MDHKELGAVRQFGDGRGGDVSRGVKTTTILVGSQAFYNAVLATEVLCLGRWLERDVLGLFFYGVALGSLCEVLVHWGAQHFLNREAAARSESAELVPALLSLAGVTTAAVSVCVVLSHGWPVGLITAGTLLRASGGMLAALYIGRGRIGPVVVSRITSQTLMLAALALLIRPRPEPLFVGLALLTAGAVYLMMLAWRLESIGFRLASRPSTWPSRWAVAAPRLLPFIALFFLGQLLYQVDAVIIEWITGNTELVSTYMLAFKWPEGFFFIAAVVASAIVPQLVARRADKTAYRRLLAAYAVGVGAVLTLLAVAFSAFGPWVLQHLLGDVFAPSESLFKRVVWILPLHGLGFLFAAAAISANREMALLAVSAAVAVVAVACKVGGLLAFQLSGFAWALFVTLSLQALAVGVLAFAGTRATSQRESE